MNSKNLPQILAIFAIISLIALSGCISTDAPGVKSVSFTVNSGYTLAEFPSTRVLLIDFETGKTLLTKYYAGLKDKVPETTETTLPKGELDSLKKLLLENGIGLGEKYSLPEGQAIADAQGAQIKILFAVPANEKTIEIYPYFVELSGLQGKNLEQLQKIVSKLQELMNRMEKLPPSQKDFYLPGEVLQNVLDLKGKTIVVQGFISENDRWKTIKDSQSDNSAELYLQNSKNLALISGKKYNVIGTVNFCGSKEAECAIFPNPSFSIEKAVLVETGTVKLSYSPIQCGGNSWEKWHSDLNRVYIRAPAEKGILTEYFRTVQNIEILSYKNIPAPEGTIVCMACSCPRGDKIEITVNEADKAKMLELGWEESLEGKGILEGTISIGPICPVETTPPQPECIPTEETYKAYQISVYQNGKLVTTFTGGTNGSYKIFLTAGIYELKYNAGINFEETKIVAIESGKTAIQNISIDTGIR